MTDIRTQPTKHQRVLIDLAHQYGWKRGAEVGVLKGKTLRAMMAACHGLQMVAVDKWQQVAPSNECGAETYERYDMAVCEAEVMEIAKQYVGRVRIIKGDSVLAAQAVENASLDFVFIDAAHTAAYTVANLHAWIPKVKPGGMVTGHDWWWPSVRDALDAVIPGWSGLDESVWAIERDKVRL